MDSAFWCKVLITINLHTKTHNLREKKQKRKPILKKTTESRQKNDNTESKSQAVTLLAIGYGLHFTLKYNARV